MQSEEVLALRSFACEFSCATKCLGSLARALFGRLFVVLPEFHFAKNALALQFLLQRAECLINVVVANLYLHRCRHPLLAGLYGDPEESGRYRMSTSLSRYNAARKQPALFPSVVGGQFDYRSFEEVSQPDSFRNEGNVHVAAVRAAPGGVIHVSPFSWPDLRNPAMIATRSCSS